MPDYCVYGVHFYGTALYGLPPTFEFELKYFVVNPEGYDRIKVEWSHPSGDWDRMRLMRGNYGFPVEYNDGTVLLDVANNADPGTYEDSNVTELRFYYYSMFLRMTTTGDWRRAGNAVALMPKNYMYTERFYELTPDIYRNSDIFVSPSSGHGMLQTFYGIFGYELDKMRSEIESLRWINDPSRISGGLLPYLADQLGFPYEAELGMGLVRQQLLNAVYLYKLKGSRLGVEGAVSVLTGWSPYLSSSTPGAVTIDLRADRLNEVENPSAETNVTFWTGTNATIAQDATQFQYGTKSFRLTVTATLAAGASMQTPAGTAGMPVTPGRLYTASMSNTKPSGTARNLRTDIIWYDAAGAQIGSPVLGEEMTQVLGNWGNRPSVTATAPAGATTAAMRVNVLPATAGVNPGAGENQYFDGALFESGGLGPYFDGSVGSPIADYLWEGTPHLSPTHHYSRRAIKNSRLITRLPDFLPAGTTLTLRYAEPV